MALTKKEQAIYTKHGITTDGTHLIAPNGMRLCPMLKNNNSKVGKSVYTFGILPTAETFRTAYGEIRGTCPCTCEKGYCTKGCYNWGNVIDGLAVKTILVREHLDWVKNAIIAQIETIGANADIRIHDVGDFDSIDYLNMWVEIATACPNNNFWTYTKHTEYESAFDGLKNANIVRSMVDGCGYNFGHIDYVLNAYRYLVAIGETPYICRCGIDKNQHCSNCDACRIHKYVLFIEHSTEYKAEKDPHYNIAVNAIEMQANCDTETIADRIGAMLNA